MSICFRKLPNKSKAFYWNLTLYLHCFWYFWQISPCMFYGKILPMFWNWNFMSWENVILFRASYTGRRKLQWREFKALWLMLFWWWQPFWEISLSIWNVDGSLYWYHGVALNITLLCDQKGKKGVEGATGDLNAPSIEYSTLILNPTSPWSRCCKNQLYHKPPT